MIWEKTKCIQNTFHSILFIIYILIFLKIIFIHRVKLDIEIYKTMLAVEEGSHDTPCSQ